MSITKNKKLEQSKQKINEIINYLNSKTCCFTGHRLQKLPWKENENDSRCQLMKKKLRTEIVEAIKNGYIFFISGMALGFDTISAEMVLDLKKEYPQIKLITALPCKDQYKLWKPCQIERYKKILSKSDDIRCLYDEYNDKCMLERNDYMLNNSSLVIALYNGKSGGTRYTIQKAQEKKLKITIITI